MLTDFGFGNRTFEQNESTLDTVEVFGCDADDLFEIWVGTEGYQLLAEIADDLTELPALTGRNPRDLEPFRVDTDIFEMFTVEDEPSTGIEIPFGIMTVAGVTAGDEDTIGPELEGFQYK